MATKRRRHSGEFRARVALEAVKGVHSLSELSSVFHVHPTVIAHWERQLVEGATAVFGGGNGAGGKSEEELTAPLYEKIGRLGVENDWLRKPLGARDSRRSADGSMRGIRSSRRCGSVRWWALRDRATTSR